MEKFWESVELMFFVYALAAVVAFAMAGLIKLIFVVIQKNKARAEARREARREAEAGPGDPAPSHAAPGNAAPGNAAPGGTG